MVTKMVEYVFEHTTCRSHLKRVLDTIRERWRTDIVTAPGIFFCVLQTQSIAVTLHSHQKSEPDFKDQP